MNFIDGVLDVWEEHSPTRVYQIETVRCAMVGFPPSFFYLSKKHLFAWFALLSVDEINPEPTSHPQPCRNPGCLQCQASLINNLDGVSAFSQTNNFIQRAEWILSKAFFHYVRMKKKLCSPFTLSPQRHLFKLLALLDVKNVVVKAHTVNCSSPPCQHEHTPAQGWRDMSPVTPQRHSLDGALVQRTNSGWSMRKRKQHSSSPRLIFVPSVHPRSPPPASWDMFCSRVQHPESPEEIQTSQTVLKKSLSASLKSLC